MARTTQKVGQRLGVDRTRQPVDVVIVGDHARLQPYIDLLTTLLDVKNSADSLSLAQNAKEAAATLAEVTDPVVVLELELVRDWSAEEVAEMMDSAGSASYLIALSENYDEELYQSLARIVPFDNYHAGSMSLLQLKVMMSAARTTLYMRGVMAMGKHVDKRVEDQIRKVAFVGLTFAKERDLTRLLNLVLRECRDILHVDAGSIYILEGAKTKPSGRKLLGRAQKRGRANAIRATDNPDELKDLRIRFAAAQNDSVDIPFAELEFPANLESIVGYAALKGEILNFGDVYDLPKEKPYRFNPVVDDKFGYRCTSMLTIPMHNMRDEVIGVIQLINKKRNPLEVLSDKARIPERVEPFVQTDIAMASTLANMAGSAIENVRLYDEIQNLFESFVAASVRAIEQRDPTTAGHSARVDRITLGLADIINKIDHGPFEDVEFTDDEMVELHYAGLLHDVGKIGVREHILTKAKKLFPFQEDTVRARGQLMLSSIRERAAGEIISLLHELGPENASDAIAKVEAQRDLDLADLESDIAFIFEMNEPNWVPDDKYQRLEEIKTKEHPVGEHAPKRLVTDAEHHSLCIRKGSLNNEERDEIQSHVLKSRIFLEQIPWTFELRNVPQIAGQHHEKINGHGYPDAVPGIETPLQSRIMAVADVFDSLTASDRPYKPAIPLGRAIKILQSMADEGDLDPDVVKVFIDEEVWEKLRLKVVRDHEATAEQLAAR